MHIFLLNTFNSVGLPVKCYFLSVPLLHSFNSNCSFVTLFFLILFPLRHFLGISKVLHSRWFYWILFLSVYLFCLSVCLYFNGLGDGQHFMFFYWPTNNNILSAEGVFDPKLLLFCERILTKLTSKVSPFNLNEIELTIGIT